MASDPKQAEQLPEAILPGARILIVDDEPGIRRTLTQLFARMGYRTAEATTGRDALALIAQDGFDLVILDIRMPDMDGTDVLKAARSLAPETVFILLTGHGGLDSAIIAVRHGAFDYLLKPSPVQDIVRAVQEGLLERKRRQSREEPMALLERALTSLKSVPERQEAMLSEDRFLQVPDITVDTLRRIAVVRGQPVELTLSHASPEPGCLLQRVGSPRPRLRAGRAGRPSHAQGPHPPPAPQTGAQP